ncbi:RNA pseudouridylate synthase domain-containing protein 1 [Daphnia magna]|uniref:RNA pseudouridylate synthase domain-containing protein 1 n=1 Tax=Daphnia magna TaxID=35525 RepID=A0A164RTJ5_9CRUS|nr:RNA pseudouridylate synthase domain-containing protein 1 [Daphnia magna]
MAYWTTVQAVYSWAQKLTLWSKQTLTRFIYCIPGLVKIKIYKLMVPGSDAKVSHRIAQVLHQSPNFLVIDKLYDVLINSNDPTEKLTVEHQLRKLFPNLANDKLTHGFHFVHRLDYSTSGVLCIACNKKAANLGGDAFSARKTKKYYIALLRGHVSHELIDIAIPIGVDKRPGYSHKMCSVDKSYCQYPKAAFTRLLVLQKGFYHGFPATKVLLKAVTGRRHQLRVHCSSLGHTIIGDFTYSNGKDVLPYRMFLHSHRLILPTALETIDVCANDPFDIKHTNGQWLQVVHANAINLDTYEKLDCQLPDIIVDDLSSKT